MNRTNPLRIAIWAMLSGFGLTVAMAVPNLDSTRALLLAGRLAGDGNGTTNLDDTVDLTGNSSNPIISIEPETAAASDSPTVPLGPITPNDSTPEFSFDTARFESHLMELLEKVDRLEHFQMQRQMSVPDPSAYLFFQNQLFQQLELLDDRLRAIATHQPVEHSVPITPIEPITPDTFRPILRTTQSTHDPLSPERNQDENSSDTVPLPRIIPKGTPW
jgi:hypothetical protein